MIFPGVTKDMIIETLAKERRVETLVENIAHSSLNADLKDLCQMVYLVLLEYDESKLQDLWQNNEMNFRERSISMGVGADINDNTLNAVIKNVNGK